LKKSVFFTPLHPDASNKIGSRLRQSGLVEKAGQQSRSQIEPLLPETASAKNDEQGHAS